MYSVGADYKVSVSYHGPPRPADLECAFFSIDADDGVCDMQLAYGAC